MDIPVYIRILGQKLTRNNRLRPVYKREGIARGTEGREPFCRFFLAKNRTGDNLLSKRDEGRDNTLDGRGYISNKRARSDFTLFISDALSLSLPLFLWFSLCEYPTARARETFRRSYVPQAMR